MNQTCIYQHGELFPSPALDTPLLVADSFLVTDGKVRSLNLHLDRFRRGIELKCPELEPQLDQFFLAFPKELPENGRLFPRLEVRTSNNTPALSLVSREAPAQLGPATLWTYPEPDPRLDLSVKGPELALGAEIRVKARQAGADEAILLTSYGEISEGALSSLVWWRGDLLCAPGNEIPWLESVTRTEIFTVAKSLNIQTRLENVKPEDLIGLEVWVLSSLQGIRVVENWVDLSSDFKPGEHIDLFNKRLKLLETQIH